MQTAYSKALSQTIEIANANTFSIVDVDPLTGRYASRQIIFESHKVSMSVAEFVGEFISDLFNDEDTMTYNELYSIYAEMWQQLTKQLNKGMKFVKVNDKYFEETFKPI